MMKILLHTKTPGSGYLKLLSFSFNHFLYKQNPQKTPKKLNFEKLVQIDGQHLISPELIEIKSLCRIFEKYFSKSAIDLGFYVQVAHQIKPKPDAKPFCRAYGNMNFDMRKTM